MTSTDRRKAPARLRVLVWPPLWTGTTERAQGRSIVFREQTSIVEIVCPPTERRRIAAFLDQRGYHQVTEARDEYEPDTRYEYWRKHG